MVPIWPSSSFLDGSSNRVEAGTDLEVLTPSELLLDPSQHSPILQLCASIHMHLLNSENPVVFLCTVCPEILNVQLLPKTIFLALTCFMAEIV